MAFGQKKPQDHNPKKGDVTRRAEELDERRRIQISNQVDVINRLMNNGGSYDEAFQSVVDELTEYKLRVKRAVEAADTAADRGEEPSVVSSIVRILSGGIA